MDILSSGDVIADRYEVIERIGAGGFSIVWRGKDLNTNVQVAVKYPNYESSNADDVVEKYFRRELETMKKIEAAGGHPNSVGLIDVTNFKGNQLIILQFIEGKEVGEYIDESGPITDPDIIEQLSIDICDIMAFLHENEIVYRDLKPDNLMITPNSRVHLIDFNTAIEVDQRDQSKRTLLASDRFKSPEIQSDSELGRQGPWTDVYAIGKLIFYLIHGHTPKKDGANPLDYGAPHCPRYLGEIIKKATSANPDDRYSNARLLKRAIENHEPIVSSVADLIRTGDSTGKSYQIRPGDTIGRKADDGPDPSVVITDEGHYISAIHARFEMDNSGQWMVEDMSINGTYVQKENNRWEIILSERGYEKLSQQGVLSNEQIEQPPPTSSDIESGDLIALVDPSYMTFQFSVAES